jgi:3-hydroxyacyl-CoA dehydrogenase
MINEAIETLYNKVAGVYEIDTVMKWNGSAYGAITIS